MFAEIFVWQHLKDQAASTVALLQSLFACRVKYSPVYSYQGGDHGNNPTGTRPADWVGEGYTEKTEYCAHEGDLLVCIGTADRYDYVQEHKLRYVQYEQVPTAAQLLADLAKTLEVGGNMFIKLLPWLAKLATDESLSRRSGMIFLFAEGSPGQSRPTRYASGIQPGATIYFSHGCGEGLVASEAVAWEPESLAKVVAALQALGFAVPAITSNPSDYAF